MAGYTQLVIPIPKKLPAVANDRFTGLASRGVFKLRTPEMRRYACLPDRRVDETRWYRKSKREERDRQRARLSVLNRRG